MATDRVGRIEGLSALVFAVGFPVVVGAGITVLSIMEGDYRRMLWMPLVALCGAVFIIAAILKTPLSVEVTEERLIVRYATRQRELELAQIAELVVPRSTWLLGTGLRVVCCGGLAVDLPLSSGSVKRLVKLIRARIATVPLRREDREWLA